MSTNMGMIRTYHQQCFFETFCGFSVLSSQHVRLACKHMATNVNHRGPQSLFKAGFRARVRVRVRVRVGVRARVRVRVRVGVGVRVRVRVRADLQLCVPTHLQSYGNQHESYVQFSITRFASEEACGGVWQMVFRRVHSTYLHIPRSTERTVFISNW